MSYIYVLLLLCATSCDFLWVPACLDDPDCQIGYQATPSYALAGATQSWLLHPMPPNTTSAVQFKNFSNQIAVELATAQSIAPPPSKIEPIYDDGSIGLSYGNTQSLSAKISGINMQFGVGKPTHVPLSNIDLGCNLNSNRIEIGRFSSGNTTAWVGLRAHDTRYAYVVNNSEQPSPFIYSYLHEYHMNNLNDLIAGVQGVQLDCEPVVTKNFALQSCFLSDKMTSGLYIINPRLAATKLCNSNDNLEVYCGQGAISSIVHSSIDDTIVIVDGSDYWALRLTNNGKTIDLLSEKIIDKKDVKRTFLFDLNKDNSSDLIFYKVDGDVAVYLQNPSGFIFSNEYSVNMKVALDQINELDPNPLNAMVGGHVFSSQAPDLIVSKVGPGSNKLWYVSLDPNLLSAANQRPGLQPLGLAVLDSPFAEPPEHLELGDLDGDGRLDLAYVAKSAAYFCLTQADKK